MFRNKIVKNASWIIACRIVQSIFGLVITMLTARYLGPSNYGSINYAASIVAFFIPIMQLGLPNILVQEAIQHPDEEGKTLGSALLMSCCSSIACIVGVVAFASVANEGNTETIIVCGLYSTLLLFQAFELMQYWYQAKYLSKYVAAVSMCAYILVALYKAFLLVTKKNIYWFAVSHAVDYFLIAIALLVIYFRLGGQPLTFSRQIVKRLWSSSKYYIVSSLMVTVFAQTDKIMLTIMVDETATGYYSAAVSCAGVTSFVFAAIIDSARPAIFGSKTHSIDLFERNLSNLYCIVIYLSLAQCLCTTILAKPIILLLYGIDYSTAIPALQLIVWYTTFSYLGTIRDIWILAEEKQRFLWRINLSGALANVCLNALLIPLWGVMGAAFASLVTQIFTNVIIGFVIKPIARNNLLMIQGLSPQYALSAIRKVLSKK